jgi:hypothetical protein
MNVCRENKTQLIRGKRTTRMKYLIFGFEVRCGQMTNPCEGVYVVRCTCLSVWGYGPKVTNFFRKFLFHHFHES